MAYPITDEARQSFAASHRQCAEITFTQAGETHTITQVNILSGGLSVNRHSVSGKMVELGSVVAAELKLVLDNSEGQFNDVVFEGTELYVRIGAIDSTGGTTAVMHFIPFGYFTVDKAPRKLRAISLVGLDRMMLFDKEADPTLLTFPTTVGALLSRICELCDVTLKTDTSTLLNHDYTIEALPETEDLTYRQYLSWLAEITGTCAFIDWEGELVLKWYEDTDCRLTPANRYESDLYENEITITGVQLQRGRESRIVGSDTYPFHIQENELIQHDQEAIGESLYNHLNGFSYTPFTAEVHPMPHLYPLDKLIFADKDYNLHTVIITDTTFVLNGNTYLKGEGETTTNHARTPTPLTTRERIMLERVREHLRDRDIQSITDADIDGICI